MSCGFLLVPEDRDDPDGTQVRLHVAVFPAETPDPASDPVVYLEGGPGGHALEILVFSFEDRFAPFLARRDVIIFDQRGTGYSTPALKCPELRELDIALLDEVLPATALTALQLEALGLCRSRLVGEGADLDNYNSEANAADVADLRIALGIEEWNLFGVSYGTRLALTTMRDHPEGIRSVILDSTVPLQIDLISETPAAVDRSFEALFSACSSDPACSASFPALEQGLVGLRDQLNDMPADIVITDFLTAASYPALLTGDEVMSLIFESLYSESLIPELPNTIADGTRGELAGLERLASLFFTTDPFLSLGMHLAVQCNEEYTFSSAAEVEASVAEYPYAAPLYPDVAGEFDMCELWDAGSADPIEDLAVSTDIPALVLAGQFDPITPPRYGTIAAATMSASFFFEFPGLAHGVATAADCPLGITLAFLDAPGTEPDAGCVEGMSGPQFLTPGRLSVNLIPFEETGPNGIVSGVVPEGWDSAGFGAYSSPGFGDTVIVYRLDPSAGVTVQTIADFWADALQVGEWVTSSYENARQWDLLTGTDGELSFLVGVAKEGDLYLTVILQSPPDLFADYTALVFLPALDAISVDA